MNLRFIERDGKKILQYSVAKTPGDDLKYDIYDIDWVDVPLVQEPRKAREFWLQQWMDGTLYNRVLWSDPGDPKGEVYRYIKCREVLPDDK